MVSGSVTEVLFYAVDFFGVWNSVACSATTVWDEIKLKNEKVCHR